MTRFFKVKYIVIIMVALALITSITAFSVSYAKWTGDTSDQITVSGSTGDWKNEDEPVNSSYGFGVINTQSKKDYDLNEKFDITKDSNGNVTYGEGYLLFTEDTKLSISLTGSVLASDDWGDKNKFDQSIAVEGSGDATTYTFKVGDRGFGMFYFYFSIEGGTLIPSISDVTSSTVKNGDRYSLNTYGYVRDITDRVMVIE